MSRTLSSPKSVTNYNESVWFAHQSGVTYLCEVDLLDLEEVEDVRERLERHKLSGSDVLLAL
jgi:hypothetical protein